MGYSKVYSLVFSVLLSSIITAFSSLNLSAQNPTYGNEWIDYSKTYYAFEVEEDGLMRISYEMLAATDLPLDPSGYRLYAFGEEVPIFISSSDNLGPNDFIEFYAQELDGYFDKQMFQQPAYHINEELCLYARIATYYLTWDNSDAPLRYESGSNEISSPPAAEEYFMYSDRRNSYNVHHRGEPTNSEIWKMYSAHMEKGEGYAGPGISSEGGFVRMAKKGLYEQADQPATAEVLVVSTNTPLDGEPNHSFTLSTNGTVLADELLAPYDFYSNTFELPLDLITDTPLEAVDIILTPDIPADESYSRLSFVHGILTYPRVFELEEDEVINFPVDNDADKYIEFVYDGENLPLLYDFTTLKRFEPIEEDGLLKFQLAQSGTDEKRNWHISPIPPLVVEELKPISFTDYSQSNFEADFLIIYHESIAEGSVNEVQRYVNYRSSEEGGAHQVLAIDVEELYHQFSHGIRKHPLSIQNFCNYVINQNEIGNWTVEPEYLLLLGKSISYNETISNDANYQQNLVPTYGSNSSSDLLLSVKNPFEMRPQLATGRLSVRNGEALRNYLNKLIEYEEILNTVSCDSELSWRKDVAQIIGIPINSTENDFFSEALFEYEEIIGEVASGNKVVYFLETEGEIPDPSILVPSAQELEIAEVIDSGLNFVNYFGSSFGASIPFFPDNTSLNNSGKYPMINFMSSFLGQVHRPQDFFMIDLTLAESKGCIGTIGNSGLLAKEQIRPLMLALHQNVAQNMYGSSWAKCLQQSIADVYEEEDIILNLIGEQSQFQGDPAVPPYHFDLPDYVVYESDVAFEEGSTNPEAESFTLSVTIRNQGKATNDLINLHISRDLVDGNEMLILTDIPDPLYETKIIFEIENSYPGVLGTLNIEIDAPNTSEELCEDNNTLQIPVSTVLGFEEPIGIQNTFDTYFQIAPNPVSDVLTLVKSTDLEYKNIAVYSSEGKQMQVSKIEDIDGVLKINLSDLPVGAYHLIVDTSRERFGKTFVKE